MQTTNMVRPLLLTALLMTACFLGCDQNEERGSLYPEAPVQQAPPTVATISPGTGLAGVTVLSITGTNFSTTIGENIVYFDGLTATVTQATATQLTVKAPNLVKDSINVRVAVRGKEQLSSDFYYTLLPAIVEYGDFGSTDEPWSIAVDNNGNVLVSLTVASVGAGVKQIAPDGTTTDFAPANGILKWTAMKIASTGELYCARVIPGIYTIPAGGGAPTIWISRNGLGAVYDLDIDAQGNIWAVGNNSSVYRVDPSKVVTPFAFTMNARAVRVNGNYLYVGGLKDTTESVWRFPFTAPGTLGAAEKVFDMELDYGSSSSRINAIAFASDGDMFIATNGADGIIVVTIGGSARPLYPGVLTANFVHFGQTSSNILYASREAVGTTLAQKLYKLNTQEK